MKSQAKSDEDIAQHMADILPQGTEAGGQRPVTDDISERLRMLLIEQRVIRFDQGQRTEHEDRDRTR